MEDKTNIHENSVKLLMFLYPWAITYVYLSMIFAYLYEWSYLLLTGKFDSWAARYIDSIKSSDIFCRD